MEKVVENIRDLHREIDEMLEEKLRALDNCMEGSKECPCGEGRCEIKPEKFQEIDGLYNKLFEDKEVEKYFQKLAKTLELGKK